MKSAQLEKYKGSNFTATSLAGWTISSHKRKWHVNLQHDTPVAICIWVLCTQEKHVAFVCVGGVYTWCPGGMCQTSGECSCKSKYTDITKSTYIRSWTVTEIMAGEVVFLRFHVMYLFLVMRYPYTADRTFCLWQQFNGKHLWSLPEE